MKLLEVAGRQIGHGAPCFIIAEAGVNHNGDIGMAKELVTIAAESGADAIKFQTFKADRLVTKSAPKANYQQMHTGANESQYEMLRKLELSAEDHVILIEHARAQNMLFMSTPFDELSADLLAELEVPLFKIPSGEIPNTPYLRYLASKGKPLIVSTGMSQMGEVERAVNAIEATGNFNYVLLHCVSNYPAAPQDVNLRAMLSMATAFNALVGYSDHTTGVEIAIAAVALGACVLEKHFTLDRSLPGPDHQASLEPSELAAMIQGIRRVELALGDGRKRPMASEANTAAVARKSLVAAQNLAAGTDLTEAMIAIRRPGTGLLPDMLPFIIGRRLVKDVPAGTLFEIGMFS